MYADTDFFLALMKSSDWLKKSALAILEKYKGSVTASETTFVELLLLSSKYGIDPIGLTSSVMAIAGTDDPAYIRAAYFVKKGVNVFDAFHASHAENEIISSDKVYDKLGMRRIKLEEGA